MTDGGIVLLGFGVTGAVCVMALVVQAQRVRAGRIEIGPAVSAYWGLCPILGLLLPIAVDYAIFNSGITVYGSHNSIGVLFLGAMFNFLLAQLFAAIGGKILRSFDQKADDLASRD